MSGEKDKVESRTEADNMKKSEGQTFEKWFAEFQAVGISDFGWTDDAAVKLHAQDWQDYYNDDYTPMETWREDCSYA